MKTLEEFKEQFESLMNNIETNTNSSEARIKLPEPIAGIQYYYTKASHKLAKIALFIAILAIIISIITCLQPFKSSFEYLGKNEKGEFYRFNKKTGQVEVKVGAAWQSIAYSLEKINK